MRRCYKLFKRRGDVVEILITGKDHTGYPTAGDPCHYAAVVLYGQRHESVRGRSIPGLAAALAAGDVFETPHAMFGCDRDALRRRWEWLANEALEGGAVGCR